MDRRNKVMILGGVIMDSYVVTKEFPMLGQDTTIKDSFDKVGGCSINVAITLRNLGCEPYIVSGLGDDHRGHIIRDYLGHQRLSQEFVTEEKESTGYCMILLDDTGERTFLTYRGCEEHIKDDILKNPLLKDMAYVYLTGYYLLNETYQEEKLHLLRILKDNGSKIVFDPGSLVAEIDKTVLEQVMRLAHIIIPNKAETELLKNYLNIEEPFHEWCIGYDYELIVIKNGAKALQVYTKEETWCMEPYRVSAIDTTGAGDSFAGGLIYSFIQQKPLEEAMKIASACGAKTTTFVEPHGRFTLDDIVQIMSTDMREENKSC